MTNITNRSKLVKATGKSIGRLCIYRRSLQRLLTNKEFVYSHELALEASVSAVQVRRDLMAIGYSGSPNRGYDTALLHKSICHLLDISEAHGVALIGVGNLGRAVIAYVARQRPYLFVAAAFDNDPEKVGRVIHGCPINAYAEMPQIIKNLNLQVGIVAVPASEAQEVGLRLIDAGVRSILNFAPTPLRLPAHIYVENLDFTVALEKAVYFARNTDAMINA